MGQLVLKRKVGEQIVIGADVIVTILGIDEMLVGGRISRQVKIGIDAPDDVPIYRGELAEVRSDASD